MKRKVPVLRPLSDEDIHDFVRRTAINHFVYPDLDADHDPFVVGAAMLQNCALDEVEVPFLQRYKEAFYRTAIVVDIQWQERHPNLWIEALLCRRKPSLLMLVVAHLLFVGSAPLFAKFPHSIPVCLTIFVVYIHTVYRAFKGKGKIKTL